MRVLVLGSGAKDHAIAWWFSKSKLIEGLYVAPGNPGTTSFAVNLPDVDPSDKNQVLAACKKNNIDFVFIGTEGPLQTGVIDHLNKNGIETFGAPGYALKLDADRKFSREFAKKHNIPIPDYRIFNNEKDLSEFLLANKGKIFTIKPNDLSPSRVMISSSDYDALFSYGKNLLEKGNVVVEDHIVGKQATISILMDNEGYFILPICYEYTNREHADKGKGVSTGGMGAICPLPLEQSDLDMLYKQIVHPTFKALKAEKLYYKGILTFSTLLSDNGPVLVDYHVRLNDPATQAMVPIIKNDLCELMTAMRNNTLKNITLQTTGNSTVAVVIASEGYPENSEVGKVLWEMPQHYLINSINNGTLIFFGAVEQRNDGLLNSGIFTTGGRAATIVGVDKNIMQANSRVYKSIDLVSFDGSWFRSDIGNKFFETVTEK
ncbi:MAG: phosphoribosylamine--glycine ligase [Spirochaetales bacterium]|nr:phosphoribosylamine--glycine ligase [Spirochaetales bacterium]